MTAPLHVYTDSAAILHRQICVLIALQVKIGSAQLWFHSLAIHAGSAQLPDSTCLAPLTYSSHAASCSVHFSCKAGSRSLAKLAPLTCQACGTAHLPDGLNSNMAPLTCHTAHWHAQARSLLLPNARLDPLTWQARRVAPLACQALVPLILGRLDSLLTCQVCGSAHLQDWLPSKVVPLTWLRALLIFQRLIRSHGRRVAPLTCQAGSTLTCRFDSLT